MLPINSIKNTHTHIQIFKKKKVLKAQDPSFKITETGKRACYQKQSLVRVLSKLNSVVPTQEQTIQLLSKLLIISIKLGRNSSIKLGLNT